MNRPPRPLKSTAPGTRVRAYRGPNEGRTGTILGVTGTKATPQMGPVSTAEALTRHLRANRQVRIAIGSTVIPEGWTPHPTTARKIGLSACRRSYAKALSLWRKVLNVSAVAKYTTES